MNLCMKMSARAHMLLDSVGAFPPSLMLLPPQALVPIDSRCPPHRGPPSPP